MTGRGEGSWHLFDYNGDGKDDLFVSSQVGTGWILHPSQGRAGSGNFDTSRNLLASPSPVIIPSYATPDDQAQMADLNGDGLIDVVYPTNTGLRARIMERQGATFGWGAERQVQLDYNTLPPPTQPRCSQPDYECFQYMAGSPSTKTGFMQLADFNGDASSDLLMGITTDILYTGNCGPKPIQAPADPDPSRYAFENQHQRADASVLPPCPPEVELTNPYALIVRSITPTAIVIAAYAEIAGKSDAVNLVDVNGDGLTDIFYRELSGDDWSYRVNTGAGLQAAVELPLQDFENQVRFADVNGDGRTDVLHLVNLGGFKTYAVLYALPAGGFASQSGIPGRQRKALRRRQVR